MGNLIGNVQDKIKTSSNAMAMLAAKFLTGLYLGTTLALIGDEIIGYGWFSFTLVIVVVIGSLMRVSRSWSWMHLLIFNLFCILLGLLLRMYILIGPG